MLKLRNLFCHVTIILSCMFMVFLVLDVFNPMMNFVDNDISRALLAVLCISGMAQSVLSWKISLRRAKR